MARKDIRAQRLVVWIFSCLALLSITQLDRISAQIRYAIQEEVKLGTPVGNVAKDLGLDLGRLTERNLRVVSGTKQDVFKVNPRDGVLIVNQRVDREEMCARTVPCITNLKAVIENPLEMHQVVVEIIDVNDNSPKFPEDNYTLEVLESAIVGSRYQIEGAHDLDVGLNSLQAYKLNHNQYFRLETEELGEDGKVPFLILQRPLDREHNAQHRLMLTATDGGKPSKSGTINITVIVSDINDNPPVCDKQKYTITIKENAPAGTFLLKVNASDSDEGVNSEIEYTLRSKLRGLSSEPFELNSRTGQLTVKGGLDYEEKQIYDLKVLAADKGAVSLSTQCNVLVRVEDVNDNKPEIEITSLSSRIREDAPPGTVVALLGVTDLDSGVNGQVVCSVPGHLPFDLKPSPDGHSYALVTKDHLDKETVQMYDITITAKDLGNPALSSTKVIQVDVLDVNDNSPVFTENPYTFYVTENNKAGMSIFSVSAVDFDGGENAAVTYSISRSPGPSVASFLNINEANGTISALKSFDFETVKTFHFQVVASDSGTPSLSSNVTVNVFILDQNDNAPVILYPLSSNGSAEGLEEIPRNVNAGHLVTKVRAYDADIGYNGWLLYSLQQVTDHSLFALDRYTGQIRTLRSFTETDEAEHKLLILVKDNGNVSLSATATVIVKVVEPKEAFAASDVKSAAKAEEEDNVTFYLMITLGSVSVLFVISIIVLIAMQCSKSTDYTSKYLQETNYDGTLCHSIQYRSGDKRYMLVGPRMSIGSTIVPGSHANTLVLPDRRRTSEEHPLGVSITLQKPHVPPLSTLLSVTGSGVSLRFWITMGIKRQTRPRVWSWFAFDVVLLLFVGKPSVAEIRYSIPEEAKEGTVVGNVAKDLGLDINSLTDRRFRVVSEATDIFFEVNPNNGALRVHRKIDREELCQGRGACLMELKVIVENPLEIHYVPVEITDLNDNTPNFPEKEQTFEIFEQTLPGRKFQLHSARDPDAGLNSIRTYTLTSNEYFEVDIRQRDDEKIPFLVLKKSLDREQKDKHTLLVTAVDGGKPQRSGTLNVSIIVLDSNDNRPIFSQEIYQIEMKENVPIGTSIFRLNATDQDEGTNGEVEYSLGKTLKRKVYEVFELNKLTGEIRVKGIVDYEETDVYNLDVEAFDKGTPPLTGECRVIIKIRDVNDNAPEIEVTSLSNTVSEDSKPGTIISLISMKDKDSGVNGKIIPSITSDVPFELKPSYKENIYSVVTKDVLDREKISYYEITIKATDCGEPPLSSIKTLNIQVTDVNDNSPHFEQSPLQFYLSENNAAGASIFSVRATDQDLNDNAAISYHIVREGSQNDIMSFLNVNPDNGQITALKSFDFETVKTFQFQVVASDSGTPSLSSNVTVNVFILDQNDNPPVILYPLSSNGSAEGLEEIPRNVNAGHLVTKVRAYDADIGYNGWLLFSLQQVTDHSLFALDRYTGQIRTLRSFTETDEAEHKLLILVKDNGNVSLSATATVIVKVVEPKEAFAVSDVKSAAKAEEEDNVTFYLMITLGSVSVLFVISIIVLIAMQCSKSTDYTSKYLQETNYDGTLCHSIQYRSGDKRYMLVGPRMSIGSTIVPGSHANTLVLPDRRRTSEEARVDLHQGKPSFSYFAMGGGGQRHRVSCCWVAGILFLFFVERIWAQLRYSVPEEVQVESPVGNVAKDLGIDISTLRDRRFRIVSGPSHVLFDLNQNNGVLYVGKIDREEICEGIKVCVVNLKIVVESPLEIHYVGVEVVDVNDHSPIFPENEQRLEIAEHTPPGTRFQIHAARDPDMGTLSVRLFKLSANEFFDIEVRDSEEDKIPFLVLKKPLDREQKAEHRLVLTALDGGSPPKSGSLNLTITVLDINDNRPVFSKDMYTVSLDENAPIGTVLIQINATDLDEGSNSEIEYMFGKTQKKKVYDTFELNRATGEIRVKGNVDFEDTEIYRLDLRASDKGQPPWTAESRVVIKIKDANDNKPEVEVTSLSNVVREDSKPGTVISLISVTDRDSGLNGKVICQILGNVPFDLTPSIEENMYSLVTKGRLDRETVSHYDITITATDCGEPPLSTVKTLSVQVSDVNDNRPNFSQNPFELYLIENNVPGAAIFSVSAADNDLNENAAIIYNIVRGDVLQNDMTSFLNVNPDNGQITALKSFDFETVKTFQFKVVASDSGTPSLSSNVTVNVFILDQNDNAPVILYPLSSNGSAEGLEEIPRNVNAGHLVTKVRAYDADIGYNGWLLFSLQQVTDHSLFALDRYTGQIRTLRSFTETDEAEHKLLILVKDNGNVSLSATATVIVKVVEPKEAFAASDVKSAAKAEEEDNVTFYLMITLGSVSVLFVISIIVLIAMQCSKSTDYTSKYLQETNYDGTLCHSIQYRSGDKRYMLVGPRMSIGSTIVPGSHANTLVLPDRRRTSEEASAQLRYSVPEEVKKGTVVGNVAKDLGLDTASLTDRRFRVASGSKETFFEVNQDNGALYVNEKIDREELCRGTGACLRELKILVENPLEMHYVIVEITDVNDHSPSFPEKTQIFEIGEQILPGRRFQLHAARDPDAGINSIRTYTISSNDHFEVDIRQRDEDKIPFLVLKKSLDREQKDKHTLLVTAVDGGKPQRSGTLNVSIIVLDSNDNRPIFSQEIYQIEIKENVPVGTSIFRLNATDQDEGTNGEVEYSLGKTLKKNVYDIFELDKLTGEIRVKGVVDYEKNDVYKLDVEATDKGQPPSAGECVITIKIKDVNDNPPEIEVTSLSNTVSEDSKPGTVISLLSVTDKDSGVNGKIITSIISDVPFELKPSFKENIYSVVTKDVLDREQETHYEITIKATDCGEPPLSIVKTLHIQISDVNDNSPHFEQNPLQFYLSENNVAGASIFSVSATDTDLNENAAISYHIVREGRQNDIMSFLNVNPDNGQITALKSFDFETVKTFHFQVVASDSGTPSLSSNVTVNVFILDQNDNPPVILYPLSSNGSAEGLEEIPRNVNAGHLVTKVRAYDADIGYNGWLLFSLQQVTDHSLFALDRYTGQIRTLRSFTETDEAEHKLLILVKDNGNVSLSATATVIVKVVEPKEAFAASDVKSAAKAEEEDNVTFYLMITLGSVSVLFVISIIVLIAMQCSKSTDYTSKYLQETNYDGTLCHSIQYRSGDKRYMLVGPRMSIGSTIVPGSHANTLVLPDRRRTSEEAMGTKRRIRSSYSCCVALYFSLLVVFGGRALAELRYSIPEEMKEGTAVGNVAKDLGLDKSSLTERRFRVVSGSKDAFFEVNPDNGALQISKKIDREELCQGSGACLIELKILVENPLEMHHIVVEISDVNDHSPSFLEKVQQFQIAEHTPPGTRFQLHAARDPDAGMNSIRTYTLSSNDHFEIDVTQSDEDKIPFLVLKKHLDREQKNEHILLVTAVDAGKPPRSGTLNVSVIVLDINDNRPMFSKDVYQAEIYENVPVGTTVTRVHAIDPDEGTNGEVEYSLSKALPRKVYDIFHLDSLSGHIKIKGELDFEDSEIYKLEIEASDKATPPLTGRCRVIIKIRDINDNPPEIEVTSLSNTVSEDSKPGTVISLISVTDKDSGVNGKIITSITSHVPFELKPSYKENIYSVVSKGILDREEVSHYEITIKATDCGEPPLSIVKTLHIQISDINDNSPHFEQNPLQFYLSENNAAGASIFSVRATDQDLNDNAAISYHIVREGSQNDIMSFLNVNSDNGQITALKSFDFETVKTFQFQVVASDSGTPSLSSNVTVNVFILDQNDNAPVILYPLSSNGSAEGLEEIPRNVNAGHLVTKVRAYDADIGYNGWLLYSLQQVTDHSLFALDRYTGQIRTLRSFTETDEAEHKLLILVKDNGNVSLSATATVIVKVVEPKEAFAASDVKSAAKAEEEDNVTFYLMITLGSVSVLFVISIIVLIAMQCSKSTDYTSKYLQETNYDGTLCHSIQYRSGDKRYMLVGPRMSIGSTIVPGSHANTLVLPDRRRTSEEIRYSVPEEVQEGTVVGNVAKDLGLDLSSLTDRRFRVVSGSEDAIFEVNQKNGALFVHKHIDREELCQGSGACLMELKILVENPLEMHYVVVEVTDVNDHSPSFPERAQIFEIGEQTLPGRRFQLHTARDPDAGVNSIRTYTVTSNEHFEVNVRQGDAGKIPFLVLKKSLDREQKDKHTLLVTAVDGGKPQRSGTLNVSIIVLDSNDNRPIFSQEIYEIQIEENVPVGTSIFRLNATDPDEGINGEVEYSLGKTLKKNVYDIFELDKLTGEMRVKGMLDYEKNDVYELDIEASDKGSPPLTGESRIIIKIKDINDNSPEVEVTSLSNTVSEDLKPGTVISLISVRDKDSSINGKIHSHIINDVPFELKPSYKENMYAVVTQGLLDREKVSHYEIKIKATDCGEPSLSTFKTLHIEISDVNDNSPHFEQSPLEFYMAENNVPGNVIFSVSATDKDLNDNAAISYHIVREGSQNDIMSFLNVNPDNGQITALKSFDFETVKTFQFQVVASDSGTPSLSSNVTVNVFILDQNDNAPVILYPLSSNGSAEGLEEIPRNVNAGHLVTKVRAYDADIGYNGWLLYSLQQVTDHSLFALDRYTGQIRTLRSFTETDEAEHKLLILVKDNGNVSLSATATVIVKVVEPKEAFAASDVKSAAKAEEEDNVTFYLMITLGSVSVLFVISIIVLIAMQCSKSTDYTSKYLQETNYDGTLCHSIQYRSGDKRYMLVGPRMSIGSTIVPGSHANTLVLPDRRRTSEEFITVNEFTSYEVVALAKESHGGTGEQEMRITSVST
ncbi:uncharacterized protein V6R79_015001 [Siganus canaliculatus]